jgi:hypothetical protein
VEKTKKNVKSGRGVNRVNRFAAVLSKEKYNEADRDAAARWFLSVTLAIGKASRAASTLKVCAGFLGLPITGSRGDLERVLLLHPGLFVVLFLTSFQAVCQGSNILAYDKSIWRSKPDCQG